MATNMSCYRELIRGMNAFSNAKGNWHIELHSPEPPLQPLLDAPPPDGMLFCLVRTPDLATALVRHVKYAVGVCGQHRDFGLAGNVEVESDDQLVGEEAARYFLQKGFVHFAYVGNDSAWSHKRCAGFEQALRAKGYAPVIYTRTGSVPNSERHPEQTSGIIRWLHTLPKPLAVLAGNDAQGREIVEACGDEGIRVPDEVAVLGVDNDDLDCELSHPPLSSIAIPWQRLGFEAAELLHRQMNGETVETRVYTVPPIGVIERQSTDTIAISDPEVVAAVRFIRENGRHQISVDDVLRQVPASRRSLEKRFRAMLGRSPLEEIRRVHIELAKQLLAKTDMSMPDVAANSGFGSAAWLSRSFHHIVGETPMSFRKRYRRH